MSEITKRASVKEVFGFYAHYARHQWWLVLVAVVGSTAVALLNVTGPVYFARFIDTISAGNHTDPQTVAAAAHTLSIALLIALLSFVTRRFYQMAEIVLASRVMRDIEQDAFDYTLGHSYTFFGSTFTGSLVKRIARLTRVFDELFSALIYNFLPLIISITGVLVVVFYQNTWLGIGLLGWVIIYIGINIVFARWLQPRNEKRAMVDSEVGGKLADVITNSMVVKSHAAQKYESGRFGEALGRLKYLRFFIWTANEILNAIQGLMVTVVQFGLLFSALLLWEKGALSVGDFTLLQMYLVLLMNELWGVGRYIRSMFDSLADAGEGVALVTEPHGVRDLTGAPDLNVNRGEITFTNVGFEFVEATPVFDNLSFSIRGGEKVALVGASGTGKTTITRLLMRFHDVTSGAISIDGQNIGSVTQNSLHLTIGLVPQEPILFHRSLRENIAYGKQDATEEEIIEAAKKAHCHEFIALLPSGYDTLVGERGVKLSGGERQRVAIARAILKNAPILILDEATSSLDSESESYIQDALRVLMEGKTVIVIAHRLSTIMQMDRIIVMEKGTIIDEGTHQELIAREGVYQKLWNLQAGGFIAE